MKCPRCEFDNPEGMNFCGACGAALGHCCGKCGKDNPATFQFCGNCGAALSESVPAPAAQLADEGERRQLTVMFCDLVGSTALSHQLDPEDLHEVTRQYQQLVAQVVQRYGGYVAQYLGDGLLIYFGYPRAHEDDARRAVESGMEILSSMDDLNESISRDGVSLALRIGVHTGPVVTVEIGANAEKLALGATPNVAARVQNEAAPGCLVLTRSTRALVQPYFELVDVGERDLKGVADPVTLYQVVGTSAAGFVGDGNEPRRSPFVGRQAEMQTMVSLLERTAAGSGAVLLIRGEPGIGKSRLLGEVRRISRWPEARWFTCHCSAYHQNTALYPVVQLVGRVFGFLRADGSEQRLARIRSGLAGLDLEPDAEALLAGLLGLAAGSDGVSRLNPVVRRRRTLRVVVELLVRADAAQPKVIVVEDLHWSDPSTLEFLELLVARAAQAPVAILLSHRPEFVPMWSPPSYQNVIELARLSDADAEAMVDAYNEVPAALRRQLVARTDGIPLFLEELTRSMLDRETPRPLGWDDYDYGHLVPDTLRDLLMARLDALGGAKEVAQLGALLGRRFQFELLASVSDADPVGTGDLLQRVVDSGLLIRAGELPHATFTFKHALIQDVAYDSLLLRRRRELHNRVVDSLVSRFPDIAGDEPETLAWHYEEAGRYAEAVDAYRRAAARSLETSAYAEAIHHLHGALKALAHEPESAERDEQEVALLQMLSQPMSARHGYTYPELEKLYDRTLELVSRSERKGGLVLALFNIWAYRAVRGERERSAEAAEKLRAAAQSASEGERDLAGYALGSNAFFLGKPELALRYLSPVAERIRARTSSDELGQRSESRKLGTFIAWVVQCWALALAGHLDRAWESVCELVATANRLGDPFALAQALSHQAMVSHELAHPAEEIANIAALTHAISEEQGLAQTLQSSRLHLGWAAAVLEGEDQTAAMRDSIEATRAMGTLMALPHRLVMLAETHAQLGQPEEALAAIDECLTICKTNAGRVGEPDAHRLRGVLLAQAGDLAAAEASFVCGIEIARERGLRLDELRTTTELASMLNRQNRGREVAAQLDGAIGWFSEGFETKHLMRAADVLRQIQRSTAGPAA